MAKQYWHVYMYFTTQQKWPNGQDVYAYQPVATFKSKKDAEAFIDSNRSYEVVDEDSGTIGTVQRWQDFRYLNSNEYDINVALEEYLSR